MSKNYHSHGFLYHPGSQQILLQQKTDEQQQMWTLLESLNGESFQRIASKHLNLKLQPKAVLFIYDYAIKGKKHLVSYAEVKKLGDFPATKIYSFKWFTIKEISKLPISSQTKQDLIVGRRVIDSQVRRDAGEQTIG